MWDGYTCTVVRDQEESVNDEETDISTVFPPAWVRLTRRPAGSSAAALTACEPYWLRPPLLSNQLSLATW